MVSLNVTDIPSTERVPINLYLDGQVYLNQSDLTLYYQYMDSIADLLAWEEENEDPKVPYYIKAMSMTFCVVIICLGVIGNVMVPIVILKTKELRNSTNIFLLNLSLADLMTVLLVCMPTLIEFYYSLGTWVMGLEMCLAVRFIGLTVTHVSVLTILALSFERYYAICKPLKAAYVCTNTRAAVICALAWFFAALFASPILGVIILTDENYNDGIEDPICPLYADTYWSTLFFILDSTVFFIIPLIILLVLYSIIARKLIENSTFLAQNTQNRNNSDNVIKYRKQVIVMLGTVILIFFVCFLPFQVFQILITMVEGYPLMMALGVDGFYIFLYFCRVVMYLHSAINPILYNLMSSKFREGFVKLLKINKVIRCSRNLGKNINTRDETTSTGLYRSKVF